MTWNLTDAKNKLSEILDLASREGPQRIQRKDETFLLLPENSAKSQAGSQSFKNWLLNGPSLEGLDLERQHSTMREIDP